MGFPDGPMQVEIVLNQDSSVQIGEERQEDNSRTYTGTVNIKGSWVYISDEEAYVPHSEIKVINRKRGRGLDERGRSLSR